MSVCSRTHGTRRSAPDTSLEDGEDRHVPAAGARRRLLRTRDARGRYCPAAASPRGVCAGADSAVQRWRVRGAAPAQAVGPTVEVWAGRHQYDAGGRGHAAARPWAPVHRVVPAEASDPFGAVRRGQGAACHDARPHPARPGFLVPAHEDLEGESRPRLCRQNNASAPSTGRHRRTPA